MNRDQRQLLAVHGGNGVWQGLLAGFDLILSSDVRRRRRRFIVVSAVLKASLADPDDFVAVSLRTPRKIRRAHLLKWVLLVGLVAVIVVEYRSYTFPMLSDWIQTLRHRCGL